MNEQTVNVNTVAQPVPEVKRLPPRSRSSDHGAVTRAWDWIDQRQIDKHFVSLCILYGTVAVTRWAMHYAEQHADKSGIEVAAVMASIMAPYMALQAAAISFYFKARA